jgi:hypothetical protein
MFQKLDLKLFFRLISFTFSEHKCNTLSEIFYFSKLSFIESLLNLAEEGGPDDAAAPPHERDAAEVQLPVVGRARLAEQHEALSVRNDLRCVQCLSDFFDEILEKYPQMLPTLGFEKRE